MKHSVLCICGEQVDGIGSNYKRCPYCNAELRVDGKTPYARIPEDSIEERKQAGKTVNGDHPILIQWVKSRKDSDVVL